jgi:hypothetical protein
MPEGDHVHQRSHQRHGEHRRRNPRQRAAGGRIPRSDGNGETLGLYGRRNLHGVHLMAWPAATDTPACRGFPWHRAGGFDSLPLSPHVTTFRAATERVSAGRLTDAH